MAFYTLHSLYTINRFMGNNHSRSNATQTQRTIATYSRFKNTCQHYRIARRSYSPNSTMNINMDQSRRSSKSDKSTKQRNQPKLVHFRFNSSSLPAFMPLLTRSRRMNVTRTWTKTICMEPTQTRKVTAKYVRHQQINLICICDGITWKCWSNNSIEKFNVLPSTMRTSETMKKMVLTSILSFCCTPALSKQTIHPNNCEAVRRKRTF